MLCRDVRSEGAGEAEPVILKSKKKKELSNKINIHISLLICGIGVLFCRYLYREIAPSSGVKFQLNSGIVPSGFHGHNMIHG